MSHGGGIQERIPSRPGSNPASPGVQERIGALRIGGGAVGSPRPAASSPLHRALGTSASPAVARNANYTPAPSLVTDGGGIQERIRMAPGTEIARTVAVRRSHVPSHYAMLGVPRDFSPELLKKQYRLLALRYHPDAAERNGVDADEVAERFIALQTAYEVAAQFRRAIRRNSAILLERHPRLAGAERPGAPPALRPRGASAEPPRVAPRRVGRRAAAPPRQPPPARRQEPRRAAGGDGGVGGGAGASGGGAGG